MAITPSCLCGTCKKCKGRERARRYRESNGAAVRAYHTEYMQQWRARHADHMVEYAREYSARPGVAEARRARCAATRAWLQDQKRVPCADCGNEYHPAAMDFHHVGDGKDFTISQAMTRSRAKLAAEIAKCVVLCAVCHRLRHHDEEPPPDATA